MHEILTKQNLEASLRLGIPVEVTCEHGHTCCVRGELLHDVTTDVYSYRDGGTLFSNTTHLETYGVLQIQTTVLIGSSQKNQYTASY